MENFEDLIIELFSEEIPARFQVNAAEQFENLFKQKLDEYGFNYEYIKVMTTPRRMSLLGRISPVSEEKLIEKKGPIIDAPEKAIYSFLESVNLTIEQCERRDIKGKTYLYAIKKKEASKLVDCLPTIVNDILVEFKWPKSMHWGDNSFMWARPLRNVLCVFAGQLVDFEIKCIGKKTVKETLGHRFLGTGKPFEVISISEYKAKLEENGVILDREKRLSIIQKRFNEIESEYNIKIDIHQGLLQEVVGLVEFPVVYVGEIPDEYMSIPEEILEVTMRVNQRYFCTRNLDGSFSKYFIFVANIPGTDGGKTIILGNQRVLCARLADAKFFVENDKKKHLEKFLPLLKKLSFQDGLGTMYDKSNRLVKIAEQLAYLSSNVNSLKRAAQLSKCDLKTEAVCEFPEVQGIMGGYYAKSCGETPYVYNAIYEQYLPLDNKMPKTEGGSLLSIVDKLDSLVSFFAIGKIPTGSKDPFALRRAAIGILKIIRHNELNLLKLEEVLNSIFDMLKENFPDTKLDNNAPYNVALFLKERLKVMFKEQGIKPEMIDVFKNYSLLEIMKFSEYLKKFLGTEKGDITIQAYKRAFSLYDVNIAYDVDVSLFEADEERDLFNILNDANILLAREKDIEAKLDVLVKISNTILAFFDNILINSNNINIKQNRLKLVSYIVETYKHVGDFSKLI